ncbi:cytochrome P450 52A12 [[Candida] railenensis]|uniref:Cytochrome P450 52A12 n=1 Tax=[Candida] railenensis TaxID=45579 RepID=A0A9P0QTB4_9ASCO|nr:cytochrome P450 52A12 [[Candida] railenensis]
MSLTDFTVKEVFLYVIGFFAVYQVLDYFYFKYQMRRAGCKPIFVDGSERFFGFEFLFKALRMQKNGTLIDYITDKFNKSYLESTEEGKDVNIGGTATFRVAGMPIISTRDPENIKAILGTQFNDFSLGIRHAQFAPLLGDGIFTLDGNGWKHSRAMLRPQFARDQISHIKSLEPHVALLCKHITNTKGAEFDIQELFFRFTVDSSTEFLFGESVSSLIDLNVATQSEIDELDFAGKLGFADAFNEAQKTLFDRSLAQEFYFLVDSKKFRENCKKVHTFAEFFVQKALNASSSELEEKSKDSYIFLYELVKETRNPITLRDQLLNILVAGRDTTAGLLSFTMFELARNPNIWAKLRDEIETNFGTGENSRLDDITFESMKRCDYLKAILNEVLRMYPSVPSNFRIATKNTTLPKGGGKDFQSPIFVRKGMNVIYSVSGMHKNPYWYGDDYNVFRPERWLTGETKKLGWAYLPFNGGPRICLGQQFALTEASYVIIRLIQQFPKLRSFDDVYPPKKNAHLTMSHFEGVKIGMST